MTEVAWRDVERLFTRCAELSPAERTSLLARECAGDPTLRAQMDSLMAAHDALAAHDARATETGSGEGFLQTLDTVRAGAILDLGSEGGDTDELAAVTAPTAVGRYQVIRPLGRGGMGVVYLARDPTLDRPVAIKLLKDASGPDPTAARRFFAEARAASALDHPNIGTVFEVGEADGRPYIAMAYYEGETLRQRIADGALPAAEAASLAAQVAGGLRAAHANGIVHRDIKPENLIVAPHGLVKIVDFGVARFAAQTLTQHGGSPGTVAYMSPEQTRGEPVDGRADIWALGVVLYELLTGRRPFQGDALDVVIYAIRNDPHVPVCELRPEIPPALSALVDRCLEKRPERRFADTAELGRALQPAAGLAAVGSALADPHPALTARADGRPRRAAKRRAGLIVATILVLLLAGGAWYLTGRPLATGPNPTLVLADLGSGGGDAQTARVVTEALRIDLLRSPAFRLADAGEVASALGRMARDPTTGVSEADARELAQREGYEAVIAGDVGALGGGYVLTARVVAAADGATLAAFRETARDSAGLIDAVDRLSKRVRREVGEPLRTLRRADPLPRVATASLPALRRYAEANRLAWSGGDAAKIAQLLEETIALDSTFAAAHRGLAVTYWNMRADRSRIVRATLAAYALRDRLPERERYLVEASYHWQLLGDPHRTAEAYRRLLAIEPDNVTARNNLGLALLFDGEPIEAERVLRAGTELEPASGLPDLISVNLARALYFQGRTDDALAVIDNLAHRPGGSAAAEILRVRVLGGDHRWSEANAAAESLLEEHGRDPTVRAEALRSLWHLALLRGRLTHADTLYAEMARIFEELEAHDALARAVVQHAEARRTLRADPDGARTVLEAGFERRDLDLFTAGATLAPRAAAALAAIGDTVAAGRLVDTWEAQSDEARGDPDTFSPELARARIDLAAGRFASAVRRLQRASTGTIQAIHYLPDLALAHRRAGQPDSAIAVLQQYLGFRHTRRLHRITAHLGPALVLLAELHEEAGDTAAAVEAHAHLAELWEHADPELQHHVDRARRRIAELDGRDR